MIPKGRIRQIINTVDSEIKSTFPNDYAERCMYTAAATKSLLERFGHKAIVVSGNILVFVVSVKGDKASFQGFGKKDSDISHLWVECEDTLIDITPSYLNVQSSYPLYPIPPIAWYPKNDIPAALKYEPRVRYARDFKFQGGMPGLQEKIDGFCLKCSNRMNSPSRGTNQWILFNEKNLKAHARKNNIWAMSVLKFQTMPDRPTNPVFLSEGK